MANEISWSRRLAARFYYKMHGWGKPKVRTIDLSLGHPAAPLLMDHIAARRWNGCESLFSSLRVDERFVLLSYCAQQALPSDAFDDWSASSESFIARLFRGTLLTYAAWDARGGARESEVSEAAAAEFTRLLDESWHTLLAAHEAAPDDPEPLTRLIPVAMGLEVERNVLSDLFVRCTETRIPHLGAAIYMAEALSAKWLGSTEESLDFARGHAERFPEHRAVVAVAHVENWVWERMHYEDKRSEGYFLRPSVQAELRHYWQREPDFAQRSDYFRFAALNTYAFCFMLSEDDERTRDALRLMGDGCTPKPWIYSTDNPVQFIDISRRHLGLTAL